MANATVIGIDLAKSVIQLHGSDASGRCVFAKKMQRKKVLPFLAKQPPCVVGMEACGGSHYWAREIKSLGHDVKLMPPQYVKPYVKTHKTDAADAEAICEAVIRPNMRFVPIKSVEQQAVLLVHRERDGLMKERTSIINRLRAVFSEFGITIPAGAKKLHVWLRDEYPEQEKLPVLVDRQIQRIYKKIDLIEQEVKDLDREIDLYNKEDKRCKRLLEVPGIGRLAASAMVASVGSAKEFRSGRQFAAWLGLVPNQHSSGGKQNLLGISKRGDVYIRRMLIHGARAVVRHRTENNAQYLWIESLMTRRPTNVVVVALANKLARIAWALLNKEEKY